MGMHVLYQGQDLGSVCSDDTNTGKDVFVANGLDSLMTLFRIKPGEEVELEVRGKMPYEQFRDRVLSRIFGFYPTREAWLLKNYPARTLAEFEASREPN